MRTPRRITIARRTSRSSKRSSPLKTALRRFGLSRTLIALLIPLLSLTAYVSQQDEPPPPRGAVYTLQGRIVRVADGDTATLLSGHQQHRIRLASIDAPETGHGKHKPGQSFGQASQQHLYTLVGGKTLTARCYEKDHYGREVCDILVDAYQTANALQVEMGYAWANTMNRGIYLRDTSLPAIERQARSTRKGLWQDSHPIPPWTWRQECWKQGKCKTK
jgi:endonuclease YncB( thermonuclease family)